MAATLKAVELSADSAEIAQSLEEQGAVVVHGLLDKPLQTRLGADLQPLLEAADPAMEHLNPVIGAFFGDRVRHISGMAGKSQLFAEEVMCHPLFLSLCDHFLLPNCADYLLNLAHVMDRGPGAPQQMLHRDEDIWIHVPRPHPELQLASVVALVDFTRENGATALVPGSHRWPREREARPEELVYAEMPAGSAVIYLGSTIHAGGTNSTSDQWRTGFHLSYSLGWLRTEENNLLAVPPWQARELSPRAQRLLGYGVHDAIADQGGYLGMLELRNPQELLREGALWARK